MTISKACPMCGAVGPLTKNGDRWCMNFACRVLAYIESPRG
jgi:hypothetical protein